MPSYVARPHVLADEFVPGYLGDSFGLFPFVHGDPLANQFDGPFLVRLIRKEVTHTSGFSFGIESRDPDIPSCWHSGTMRRSCCWSIPCHNQADPLPTNDTPASDIPQRFQCPAMLGDGGVGMGQKEMATTAAGKNRIMIFGPKDDASTSLSLGRPRATKLLAAETPRKSSIWPPSGHIFISKLCGEFSRKRGGPHGTQLTRCSVRSDCEPRSQ
jgi:hypothetical protein